MSETEQECRDRMAVVGDIESAAYAPDPKEIIRIALLAEDHWEATTRNGKVFRITGRQKPHLGMRISCA